MLLGWTNKHVQRTASHLHGKLPLSFASDHIPPFLTFDPNINRQRSTSHYTGPSLSLLRIIPPPELQLQLCSSAGLEARLGDPIGGLYTSNASAPLQASAGLRQFYEFGLYSYCGYVDAVNGTCTNSTTARRYEPFDALTADMIANYTQITEAIIKGTSFQDDNYQASTSKAAYYLLLLGTICAGLAFLTCVPPPSFHFLPPLPFSLLRPNIPNTPWFPSLCAVA